MIMDYLDFSEKNEDTNYKYLILFQEDLENAGLKNKTIYNHLSNASLFINDFLTRRKQEFPHLYRWRDELR